MKRSHHLTEAAGCPFDLPSVPPFKPDKNTHTHTVLKIPQISRKYNVTYFPVLIYYITQVWN